MSKLEGLQLLDELDDDVLFYVKKLGAAPPNRRVLFSALRAKILGYTEYVALLTQSGTSAPTATVIKNDTGATVTWSRFLAGFYRATFSAAVLTANKTILLITTQSVTGLKGGARASTTVMNVYTGNLAGALVDNALSATPIIIRIYV